MGLAGATHAMVECPQVVGRSTRGCRVDGMRSCNCNILDSIGSATYLFAEPAVAGDPASFTKDAMTPDAEPHLKPGGALQDAVDDEIGTAVLDRTTQARRRHHCPRPR